MVLNGSFQDYLLFTPRDLCIASASQMYKDNKLQGLYYVKNVSRHQHDKNR